MALQKLSSLIKGTLTSRGRSVDNKGTIFSLDVGSSLFKKYEPESGTPYH
jgi:hypothetical protein